MSPSMQEAADHAQKGKQQHQVWAVVDIAATPISLVAVFLTRIQASLAMKAYRNSVETWVPEDATRAESRARRGDIRMRRCKLLVYED